VVVFFIAYNEKAMKRMSETNNDFIADVSGRHSSKVAYQYWTEDKDYRGDG